MFKVGDKVICSELGLGTVTDIEENSKYPIIVNFGSLLDSYTIDGKMYTDGDYYDGEHIRKLTKLEKAMK